MLVSDTLVSDTMVLDTMPTERGRLMLMLRPMPLSFTPDTDIPPTDTPVSDTPDSDTPTTVLLLLPLLLPLLPLLLLPSPPSTTPFSEPRLCPTPCTLWLTPGTEPSCTPAISSVHQLPGRAGVLLGSPVVATACVVKKVTWKICGNV